MENTLENKAKLFAQYWGQKVRCWDTGNPEGLGVVGATFIVNPYLSKTHLLLKSLSSITDEDHNYVLSSELTNSTVLVEKEKIGNFHESDIYLADYLRSKGYALPYMGLSIEKQIEYGWIKLIEQ